MFSWKSIRSASRGFEAKRRTRELTLEPLESRTLLSVSPNMIDLNPYGESSPSDFVQIGDVAYFVAEDSTSGSELWVTDGTSDGTMMLKDICAGTDSSNPAELTDFGGELFFTADDGVNGQELWTSDGTTEGTVMVCDLSPGEGYQYPYGYGSYQSIPRDLTVSDGTLFFSAEDPTYGRELWMSDGTSSGTVMVKDIFPGTYVDYYGTYPNWSEPQNLIDADGTLFFTADDESNGRELWKSDGTSAGTVLVKDIYTGTYYGTYYYGQYPNASSPEKLTAMDGQLFFIAEDDTYGLELWKSDGTSAGTVLVEDIAPGTASAFTEDSPLLVIGNSLFFAANDGTYGDELWISDGTTDGTSLLKDINPGSSGNLSYYGGFTSVGETLFFSADDGDTGKELWKSDGTESGTVLVADINPGTDYYGYPNGSFPFYMKDVDGTLYFSATDGTNGRELWMSDGTAEGTVLVDDTVAGSAGLYPHSLETANGYLVFSGDAGYDQELWSLDLDNIGSNTAQLTIYVDSEIVTIPSNVGVESSGETTAVYTTDSSGALVLDSTATLGDFFAIWQTDAGLAGNNASATFSADELFGNTADTVNTVQMFVNGEISTAFEDYSLQDGDQVVLVFGSNPVLSLNTNFGPIVIELFEEATPGTVDNFLNYINDGDYLDSFFHRSVDDFVIQGGGYTTTSTTFTSTYQFSEVPSDGTIANEPGISNLRGTIAMAKQGGDPDSATSQFFVNLSDDNTFLDTEAYDYFTVFAQVLDMTTVDEIAALPIDTSNVSPYGELPLSSSSQLVVVQTVEGQGEVSGVKFLDENADGYLDSGDTLLSGVTVYVDSNENGILDAGEISTITDANGEYLLQVEAGTYQIRAEVSAGRVTTRPASSESYTITVEIGRETSDVDFGEAELSAPESVTLLPGSDSGIADDDDLTRLNNSSSTAALQFQVDGVIDGAEVSLYSDGVLVGTATASSGTATILTDGLTTLSDGVLSITATQSFSGGTSVASTALAVTIDTIAPAGLDEAPPDFPQVYVPYEFDAESNEEGQEGIQYSLVDAPSGMTIDADTGVINWTPALEQAVPQDFEIAITDAAGNVTSQAVEMTVLGVIPAYPDAYSLDEDTTLTVDALGGVLINDGDDDSGELTAALVDQPTNGAVTFDADGSFVYTPNANYFGTDTFTYNASDGTDDTNVARVTITVNNVNDVPEPVADSYTTQEDVTLTVEAATGVLANDVDIDGDVLTASLVDQAANGTVTLNSDGSFTYVPNDEFSGSDSFTYVASDGIDQSEAISVSLTVESVPDPPTSVSDAYSVSEDTTLTIDAASGLLANDTDPDSETLTVSVSANPPHGTLSLGSDGSFIYVPVANFYGTDSFTYVTSDGTNTSTEATVTITVSSVADPPTAIDDSLTASNDGSSVLLDAIANDTTEPDPDQTLTIVSVTQGVVGGTVAVEGNSIRYTAPSGVTGTDTFTYTIQDSDGLTDTATVRVSIEGSISPGNTDTGDSGDNSLAGYVFIDSNGDGIRDADECGVPGVQVTLTGTDTAGNAVNRTALSQGDGSYLFDSLASGTYQLTEQQPTAMADAFDSTTVPGALLGDDQITNIVLDGGEVYAENNFGELGLYAEYVSIGMFLASSPSPEQCLLDAIVSAEELAGNTELAEAIRNGEFDFEGENTAAPVAATDGYSATEGTVLTVNAGSGVLANDTDADGDSLVATIVSPTSSGSIALSADGSFIYVPDSGFSGTDTFTYRAYDGQNLSNVVTVTITVADSNAAPTSVGDSYSVNEDATLTIGSAAGVLSNDTDADGDTLSATLVSEPANGTLVLNADGTFTYTPNADFYGTDTFTYQAGDGSLSSATATVTITVVGVNDAPTATGDAYTVDENATLSIDSSTGVLANDADADDDGLTASLVTTPSHGTVTFNADGSFTYVPEVDFSGADSFTYQVSDGSLTSNAATVTLTVVDVNDAPVGVGDSYSVNEDSTLTIDAAAGVLANDTDVDGNTLTASLVTSPSYGTLTFNTDGSFVYTPDADFSGTDAFTYVAYDGLADSAEVTVTVTVDPVNDTPLAADDSYTVPVNGTLTVDASAGLLVNDDDVDGDSLATVVSVNPEYGTLELNEDGSFTYTPDTDFHGTDSFTYTAGDGTLNSEPATVMIDVNTLAVAADDTYSVDEDNVLTLDASSGVLTNDVDADNDSLVGSLVRQPTYGTLTFSEDGSLVYTPSANFFGTDSFSYVANDGFGDSAEATVTITVNSVNDAPVAENDQYTVEVGGDLTVETIAGVLANDTDVEGDTLTATVVAGPTNGNLTLNVDGSFSYTPSLEFHGTDTFTYTVSDGPDTSAEATVTIHVNTSPTAVSDAYTLDEDTELTIDTDTGVLNNDVDGDSDPLSAIVVNEPVYGVLILNADGSFSYAPDANFSGTDSFSYVANDGFTDSDSVTVTLTVLPANDAPLAVDDSYNVAVDSQLDIDAALGVLANDSDPEGNSVTAVIVADPEHGTLFLETDGSFSYTPDSGYHGADTFTYAVADGTSVSEEATATIHVDSAATVVADAYSLTEDTELQIDSSAGVLANDSDIDSDTLAAVLVSGPAHGTLTLSDDGSFTYTPEADSYGTDSFTYLANDGFIDSDETTVTLTVDAANDAPVSVDDAYSVAVDGQLIAVAESGVLANDSDVDGDGLSVTTVDEPTNGTLALNSDGSFTYTPVTGYHGMDTFTYTVSDGTATSGEATVSIRVNDAPSALSDAYVVSEDTELTIGSAAGVLANDTDPDGDWLTATLVMEPSNGTLTLNADGSFGYEPDGDFSGADAFTYVANDGFAESAETTVVITIDGVNDAPTAADDTYTVAVNTGLTLDATGGVSANDTDVDGDTISIAASTEPPHGALTLNPSGSFFYMPDADFHGADTFTYTITDGTTASAEAIVTIYVDTAADAIDDSYSVDEDSSLTIDAAAGVLANDCDEEGDGLTVTVVTEPANGSLTLYGDGSFIYTPDADFAGSDRFTYVANDGYVNSAEATVELTVNGISDAPAPVDDTYHVGVNDTLTVEPLEGVLANDNEPDGDAMTVVVATEPTSGTLTLNSDGSFTYTPDTEFHGTDTFTYTAGDGTATSSETTVTVHVNSAALTVADTYSVDEEGVLNIDADGGVLANDSDVNGDSLTASVVVEPAHGTLILNPDGSFDYSPGADYNGTDTFTYVANDGFGNSAEATVTITINAVNDAPTSVGDAYSVPVNGTLDVDVSAGVLANDSDAEGDALSVSVVTEPTNGSLTLNSDGSFTYTPSTDYHGSDSFTYTVTDGLGTSEEATVAIYVNTAPTVVDDAYTVEEDATLTVDASEGVLDNDSDVDSTSVTATVVIEPAHGTLSFNSDGSFSYTPDADFTGTDSFTYVGNDGWTDSEQATVTLLDAALTEEEDWLI